MNTNFKKSVLTADIECCVFNVTEHTNKIIISEHKPISVGYMWQSTVEIPISGNFK